MINHNVKQLEEKASEWRAGDTHRNHIEKPSPNYICTVCDLDEIKEQMQLELGERKVEVQSNYGQGIG